MTRPTQSSFVSTATQRAIRQALAVGRAVRRQLRSRSPYPARVLPPSARKSYELVAYFADNAQAGYQLNQWLPVFRQINESVPLLVVTRNYEYFTSIAEDSRIDVAFTYKLDDLRKLYADLGVKVVLYVNNGWRNFQSLGYQHSLHVHINHGESDKISMVSNQVKAYDHVVVAGQAAIDRHARALIGFDEDRLVPCGRPQLDLDVKPSILALDDITTVVYAPTWSGESEENNYTSVALYGIDIVDTILARPRTRLVYKPHPRIAIRDPDPAVVAAHTEIMRHIRAANGGSAVQHEAPLNADIMSVYPSADLLISDVSSVGLDFLYLHGGTPIVLTDRRTDRQLLRRETPLARAVDVIDFTTIDDFAEILDRNLADDPHHNDRLAIRNYYFGFGAGESTKRFIDFIEQEIRLRDQLVAHIGETPADR